MAKIEIKYDFVLCDCPDCGMPKGIHTVQLGMTDNPYYPPIGTCKNCGRQWAVGLRLVSLEEAELL